MLEKKFELLVPSKLRAWGSQAAQNGLVQKAADFSCRHGLRFCSFDCLSSDPSHTWRHIWAFALFTRETGGYVLLSGSWRALGIKYVKLLAQCHIMGTVGTMTRCHKVFTFSHNVSQFLPILSTRTWYGKEQMAWLESSWRRQWQPWTRLKWLSSSSSSSKQMASRGKVAGAHTVTLGKWHTQSLSNTLLQFSMP